MTSNGDSDFYQDPHGSGAPRPSPAQGPPGDRRGRFSRGAVLLSSLVVLLAAVAILFLALWERGNRESSASGAQPPRSDAAPAPVTERKVLYWHDPMHPQYRSDKPGTAPDCGMDLVPVYAEEAGGAAGPADTSFRVSPEKQQLIGVQYGEVSLQHLTKTIRATGTLTYDESRTYRIHPKTGGWIEQVFVDFTGKWVAKNQPLLTIYSPELVATQEEYLLALKARERLGSSPFKEVAAGAASLLEAARRRLELWDITEEQIEELERTRVPVKALTLYATRSGFVTARNAYERQRVSPETELYQIADLSTIWLIADIYEFEAPDIRMGQPVFMSLPYSRGPTFRGKITYIYPQLDSVTRTLKVRAEFSNPGFALKADMYADAELKVDYGRRLSIPAEAVLDSGAEQIVFVAREGGYFEPRRVRLGAKADDRFIVLDGLKEGEKIVTSGNFLIDSEARLKAAVGAMTMPGMEHGPAGMGTKPEAPAGTMDHSDHSSHGAMDHSQHLEQKGQTRK